MEFLAFRRSVLSVVVAPFVRSGPRHVAPWKLALLIGLHIAVGGCHRGTYDVRSLPTQYWAPPTTDVESLDLSPLSTGQYNSRHIQPGDRLAVTVLTGAEDEVPEPWPVVVAEDGTANVPLVGAIPLAGRDVPSAQQIIHDASIERGMFRQPTVSIEIEDRQNNHVTVLGAVSKPGNYKLPTLGSDLLSAIVAAGGLTEYADTQVEIRRSVVDPTPGESETHVARTSYPAPRQAAADGRLMKIDLASLTSEQAPTNVSLRDGDVVRVLKRQPRYIHVIGLVNKPERFEIKPGRDIYVLDALALAGGLKLSVADRVTVRRSLPGAEPVAISLSIRNAKKSLHENLRLADGDVVVVEETPTTFVIGAIQTMVRVGVNGAVATF